MIFNQKSPHLFLLAIVAVTCTEAFAIFGQKSVSVSSLNAWSLPSDMSSWNAGTMFNSQPVLPTLDFTSSWYTVSNPNRARRVYEDVPFDYSLITAGNDWPSYETMDSANEQQRVGPLGPIRKVARWVRRQK